MLRSLNGGAISVSIPDLETGVRLARHGGFESLAVNPRWLMDLSEQQVRDIRGEIELGAWGVPFDFRGDESLFNEGFAQFPATVEILARHGVTRCATWIMPGSNQMNFDRNFQFHVRRLQPIAQVLADHGMQFGLEFVGPKSLRDQFRHPFIYTLFGMLQLAEAVGSNVGVLLDCWHLHSSDGCIEDLKKLNQRDIVLVHVNDAPSGVALDELVDNDRRLPGETGVINLTGFLRALHEIGYAGPVEAEPFDPRLNELPNDEARVVKIGAAMSEAFSTAGV